MAVHVYTSQVIPSPLEKVWDRVKPFGDLGFSSRITSTKLIQGSSQYAVGEAIRELGLGDKKRVVERLVAFDETNRSFSYYLYPFSGKEGFVTPDDNPSPGTLEGYIGTVRLYHVTKSNQTFVTWEARFDSDKPKEMHAVIEDLFNSLLDDLARVLSQ
eukprot:TRINITY_DN1921_c0_g1_i1.p1 TRINITY_DN1921_c0_g1~~TRINITY_DN1921_c0_g1_i1.p1  ORF type:complete len:184 (+),score=44.48 TRINITY_DN1921_c0_g1_i1:80-553(+)